jgi:Rod binding domain-containing protein
MSISAISAQSPVPEAQILRYREARRAAAQFVGQTFFKPIFKQMRDSPFKSELFSGGRGEEVFGSMLDGILAERMGGAVGGRLIDALVRQLDPVASNAIRRAEGRLDTTG